MGESDYNHQVVAEFRANAGKVGGNFEGAPSSSSRTFPQFAEYENTANRTIPVVLLERR